MTVNLLFFTVFVPLAIYAIYCSSHDGLEVPQGIGLTVLAIIGAIAAAVGEFLLLSNGFSQLD